MYLLKKAKKDYYGNIRISSLTDCNEFWKTLNQFSVVARVKSKNSITLVEGTKIIQEEGELVKTINIFFVSIVKNLGINENLLPTSSSETRNVETIIAKFENNPIILTIRNLLEDLL